MKNKLDKVTVILRGYSWEEIDLICSIMAEKNLENLTTVEITTNTKDCFNIIEDMVYKYGDVLTIGCGTVLNLSHAKQAYKSGADFILSPIELAQEVIDYCNDKNILCVSSGLTPSEIYTNYEKGVEVIKVFPVNSMPINYLKSVKGPLDNMNLMAVGGVNIKNVKSYFENGADYVGISSGFFDKESIKNKDVRSLSDTLDCYYSEIEEV